LKRTVGLISVIAACTSFLVVSNQGDTAAGESANCGVDDARIQEFMTVRKTFAFDSSQEHVRDVSCPTNAVEHGGLGIPLNDAESAEIDRRNVVGETFATISTQELLAVPDRFAGIWLDQAAGGVVVVAYVGNGDDRLTVIRKLLPLGTAVKLVVGQTTLARLNEISDRLRAAIQMLARDQIFMIDGSSDIIDGVYSISISQSAPKDAEERIALSVGGWQGLVIQRVAATSAGLQNARDTPTGRAYGGTSIGRLSGGTYWSARLLPVRRARPLITWSPQGTVVTLIGPGFRAFLRPT